MLDYFQKIHVQDTEILKSLQLSLGCLEIAQLVG